MLGVAAWTGLSNRGDITGGFITGAFIIGGVITGVFTMEGGLRGRGMVGPGAFLTWGCITGGPETDIGLCDGCCWPILSRILGNREIRIRLRF